VVNGASAPLLCPSGAKTCFCLLPGSLELAHARRAGGPLSVGLGSVQLVALAGVLSLCSQIVQITCGHGFVCCQSDGGWSVVGAGESATGESAAALGARWGVVELVVVVEGRLVGLRELLAVLFDVRRGLDLLFANRYL
jgi:hypothetical protein